MPKIIKVGQCFTELFKNNTGTVFLRHGVVDFEWFETTVVFLPFMDQSISNLVHIYGSDLSLQRRFPIDDILFQSGYICNKVTKWRS